MTIVRISGTLAIIAAGALVSAPALADITCVSATAKALSYASGMVLIEPNFRGDFIEICNLNQTWNGVSPETCFSWFSSVNSSIIFNKNIEIYYTGSNFACATIPTYGSAPAPVYVGIER